MVAGLGGVLAGWSAGVGGGLGGELVAVGRGSDRSSVAVGLGLKSRWGCIQAMSGEPWAYKYGRGRTCTAGASLFQRTRMPARRGDLPGEPPEYRYGKATAEGEGGATFRCGGILTERTSALTAIPPVGPSIQTSHTLPVSVRRFSFTHMRISSSQ
jgi:hypothetical protein